MVYYKNAKFISSILDKAFDEIHTPGGHVQRAGVYRCEGCGHQITHNVGQPLPSQNHAQHDPEKHGTIRWRLVAWSYNAP